MAGAVIHASEVVQDMTLTVTLEGLAVVRFRLWVGTWVLRLAAYVIGCNLKVEEK